MVSNGTLKGKIESCENRMEFERKVKGNSEKDSYCKELLLYIFSEKATRFYFSSKIVSLYFALSLGDY